MRIFMDEIQEGFLNKNILLIKGEIDEKMADYISGALDLLHLAGSPDITLLFTSPGGCATDGLDIIDSLSLYPGKKTAIVVGYAASMAAIILQCCDERMATPHSKVLIHHGRAEFSLDILRDPEKEKSILIQLEKVQKMVDKILIEKTKKSTEEINTQCKKNEVMNVDEAIAFGLLDGVYPGPLPK